MFYYIEMHLLAHYIQFIRPRVLNLLFVPAQSAILLLCETEFNHMGSEGCVALQTAPQPL
jgi:hypothetical protein